MTKEEREAQYEGMTKEEREAQYEKTWHRPERCGIISRQGKDPLVCLVCRTHHMSIVYPWSWMR